MGAPGHPKTGGRVKGTPNKGTRLVRDFFTDALEQAFTDPRFKTNLVEAIVKFQLDTRFLALIVNHVAGMPAKAIDHTHSGSISLERIIAGRVHDGDDDDDGDDEAVSERLLREQHPAQ